MIAECMKARHRQLKRCSPSLPPRLRASARRAARPYRHELVIPNTHGLPYMRLDEGPMKGGSAGIWNRLREVSGVVGVSMREMRHFFAVACLSRGIPLSTVSAWMGHSDIDLTVKRYGRFAAEAREQWTWAALRAEPVEQVASRGAGLRVVQ
jgi:integrase